MAALDMTSLRTYVTGGAVRQAAIGTIFLDITHNLLQSRFVEIAFNITDSVHAIKEKVYGMTGSNVAHMRLLLNGVTEMRETDNKLLGEYGAQTGGFIHVLDEDPYSNARGGAMDDVRQVKKFELTEEEYDKRDNTYRAYKKKMKAADPNWKSIYEINSEKRQAQLRAARRAAGYPDEKWEAPESIRARIQVGQRCIVEPGARRGVVKYVGPVPELPNYEVLNDGTMPTADTNDDSNQAADSAAAATPAASGEAALAPASAASAPAEADPTAGAPETSVNADARITIPIVGECLWIGVQLDEPTGKHDGTAKGKRYFQAHNHAGIFAKPSAVKTGDYPEIDPFDSDNEQEEPSTSVASSGADIYEEL